MLLCIGIFYSIIIPIIKDEIHLKNISYLEINGIVYHKVMSGGLFDLSKTIIVTVDDENLRYQVLYSDKNIEKGDFVKVSYLPNSKYSIIEKISD